MFIKIYDNKMADNNNQGNMNIDMNNPQIQALFMQFLRGNMQGGNMQFNNMNNNMFNNGFNNGFKEPRK